MSTWLTTVGIIAGIVAGFAAVGAYVDKLISIRHKTKLHLAMHKWWNHLDETKIPNYIQLLSLWISTQIEKRFRKRHWRVIVFYLVISWFLLSMGMLLDQGIRVKSDNTSVHVEPSTQMQNLTPQGFFDKIQLPHALCFLPLIIFDFLIVAATIASLQFLKQSRGFWKTTLVIIFQIALISILAIGCFASLIYAQDFAFNHNLMGMHYQRRYAELGEINFFNYSTSHQTINKSDLKLIPNTSVLPVLSTNTEVVYFFIGNTLLEDIKKAPATIFWLVRGYAATWHFDVNMSFRDGAQNVSYSRRDYCWFAPNDLVYAGTVFFPAIIISLMLAFMYLARFTLGIVRGWIMYFFDLATERDPKEFMPATLVGITCGLFVIVIKCGWQILVFVHNL